MWPTEVLLTSDTVEALGGWLRTLSGDYNPPGTPHRGSLWLKGNVLSLEGRLPPDCHARRGDYLFDLQGHKARLHTVPERLRVRQHRTDYVVGTAAWPSVRRSPLATRSADPTRPLVHRRTPVHHCSFHRRARRRDPASLNGPATR